MPGSLIPPELLISKEEAYANEGIYLRLSDRQFQSFLIIHNECRQPVWEKDLLELLQLTVKDSISLAFRKWKIITKRNKDLPVFWHHIGRDFRICQDAKGKVVMIDSLLVGAEASLFSGLLFTPLLHDLDTLCLKSQILRDCKAFQKLMGESNLSRDKSELLLSQLSTSHPEIFAPLLARWNSRNKDFLSIIDSCVDSYSHDYINFFQPKRRLVIFSAFWCLPCKKLRASPWYHDLLNKAPNQVLWLETVLEEDIDTLKSNSREIIANLAAGTANAYSGPYAPALVRLFGFQVFPNMVLVDSKGSLVAERCTRERVERFLWREGVAN